MSIVQGVLARNRGATDRAIEYFCDALSENPENGFAHAQLSISLSAAGRPLSALEEARRALRYIPNEAIAHIAHAMAATLLDDRQAARESIDMALKLNPNSPDALSMRCAVAMRSLDWDGLETAANALRAAKPEDAEAPALLTDVAVFRRDPQTAEAEARRALSLGPNDARSHVAIGNAFYLQGRFDEAKEAGLSALAIDPDSPHAQRLLTTVQHGRLPLVGPLFRMVAWTDKVSLKHFLTYGLPVIAGYWITRDVLRHLELDQIREVFVNGILMALVGFLILHTIHRRTIAKFRKQARLKRSY